MTPQEIITSGILELYVCGALPVDEHQKISREIEKSAAVKNEVERIEKSLMELSENTAPKLSAKVWMEILAAIKPIRTLKDNNGTNWVSLTGWAAAILCLGGIFWMMNQNSDLKDDIDITEQKNIQLEEELDNAAVRIADTENVLEILRSKEFNAILLPGNQAVAPQAFSKVLYNKKDAIAYIDVKGLPEAPENKVYQVWSLVLEPLTPTSMGLINTKTNAADGLYKFEAVPETTQAFGITLEPAGGSEMPTMSQLYTLGAVAP